MNCDQCGSKNLISMILEYLAEDRRFGTVWKAAHLCSPKCLLKFVGRNEWKRMRT